MSDDLTTIHLGEQNMLTLYGFEVSNYFNMLKLALMKKQLDFNTVVVYPNQSPEFLLKSHMGKVPALETEHGMLTETNIILEYLDEAYPQTPFYPADPFQKSKVKELVKLCELYIELPARRCFAEAFFGSTVSDETKKETKRALFKGIEALNRLGQFSPFLAGDKFSAADIMFLYSIDMAASVAKKLFDIDLLSLAPGAAELMQRLNQDESVIKIAADRKTGNIAFQKYLAKHR
jgi:glutathione S-transferase